LHNGGEAAAKKGKALETKDTNSRTPLWYAASRGYKTVVKLLLEKAVKLETKDAIGRTPLSYAASRGYMTVVKPLLRKARR
jgi:ankyrin repeat protein